MVGSSAERENICWSLMTGRGCRLREMTRGGNSFLAIDKDTDWDKLKRRAERCKWLDERGEWVDVLVRKTSYNLSNVMDPISTSVTEETSVLVCFSRDNVKCRCPVLLISSHLISPFWFLLLCNKFNIQTIYHNHKSQSWNCRLAQRAFLFHSYVFSHVYAPYLSCLSSAYRFSHRCVSQRGSERSPLLLISLISQERECEL